MGDRAPVNIRPARLGLRGPRRKLAGGSENRHVTGESMRQGIWRRSPALVVSADRAVRGARRQRLRGEGEDRRQGDQGEVDAGQPAEAALGPGQPAEAGRPARRRGHRADHRRPDRRAEPRPGAERRRTPTPPTSAQSAVDAQTALNAVNAVDAKTVNGHSAGCLPGTQPFAGACWQTSASAPVNAPRAARHLRRPGRRRCRRRCSSPPSPKQPGVDLDDGRRVVERHPELSRVRAPMAVVTVSAQRGRRLCLCQTEYTRALPLRNSTVVSAGRALSSIPMRWRSHSARPARRGRRSWRSPACSRRCSPRRRRRRRLGPPPPGTPGRRRRRSGAGRPPTGRRRGCAARRPLDAPPGGRTRRRAASFAPVAERDRPAPTRSTAASSSARAAGSGYCSATAIDSPTRRLVLTAGHCVNTGPRGRRGRSAWSSYLEFVPAYTDGVGPVRRLRRPPRPRSSRRSSGSGTATPTSTSAPSSPRPTPKA